MNYTNRISALEEDQTHSLTSDGIESNGNAIPYTSIEAIHLKYAPSRYYANIYQCKIQHINGSLSLSNRRYIKLGTFEYQSESYNAFIQLLHEALNEKVKLKSGLDAARYWIELPIAITFFTLIIGVTFTFGHPLLAVLFLLIILLRLIPYYRKNYPITYQKNSIPSQILPKK